MCARQNLATCALHTCGGKAHVHDFARSTTFPRNKDTCAMHCSKCAVCGIAILFSNIIIFKNELITLNFFNHNFGSANFEVKPFLFAEV